MRDDSIKPEFPDKVPGDLHLSWGRDSRRDLLERWPTTPEGEPVTPAFLTKCGQVDLEDRLLVNMLEAYGIPCLTRYPHSGEFGKVVLGACVGDTVTVRVNDAYSYEAEIRAVEPAQDDGSAPLLPY